MADVRADKERKKARAILKKARKKKYHSKRTVASLLGVPAALILICACAFSVFSDMSEIHEKEQELEQLRQRALELEAENASYESILSEEDERTYMERIAIERLGYAYPEERRFYDTTRS